MSRDWSRRSAFGAKAERDRQLEQALQHQLRAAGTPDREACVDAETLGAWADGGLDAAQMSAVELHVSTCARCQAIAGVTARSAPVIVPAVNEGWFRFPRWALAPLAAAAAVTIWMAVPQDPMQAPPAPAQAPVEAGKEAAPPSAEASTSAQTQELPARATARADSQAAKPAPPAETLAEGKRGHAADAPATLEDRQQRAEERTGAAIGAVAAPPAPAAPAVADAMRQRNARLAVAPLEIVSPDPASRWRIVRGAIEHSADGGGSWVPIRANGGEVFTGGASPARSVCWLIGSSGLVMVTTDGVAFAQVPLAERVDLTTITAADARTATVTTVDGRRFRTEDSGRTWRQIQA